MRRKSHGLPVDACIPISRVSAAARLQMASTTSWRRSTIGSTWDGGTEAYSAACAGMRYLDAAIKAAGGEGIKQIATYLAADSTRTLDQALANASSGRFTSVADFKADFQANGATFIGDLLSSGELTRVCFDVAQLRCMHMLKRSPHPRRYGTCRCGVSSRTARPARQRFRPHASMLVFTLVGR
jgi:hypothetical protein